MVSNNSKFVIFTCVLFIVLFFVNHNFFLNQNLTMGTFKNYATGDYELHQQRAMAFLGQEDCSSQRCSNQPYLFHLLASPFSFRETGFFFFCIFFIGVIIPYTVFVVTGEKWSAFFYFTVSNFFWIARGMFTNIFAIWFCLLFFIYRKHWQRGVLLLLSIVTHGAGFYLALVVLFFIYLFEMNWGAIIPSFLGGCEGFDKPVRSFLNSGVSEHHTVLNPSSQTLTIGNLISGFWLHAPLPFFFIGLWGFVKEKQHAFIALTCVAFWLLSVSWRFQLLLGLLCIVGVGFAFKHLGVCGKRVLILMALVMGLVQFYWWESAKVLGLIC